MLDMSPTIVWAIVGVVLLIVEIFTLSFGVMFFGVSALAVAALRAAVGLDDRTYEILLFAVLGAACLLLFRPKLAQALASKRGDVHIDKQKVFAASNAVAPGATAKLEYQGTLWDAHNHSHQPIAKGDDVVVVSTEGIKLIVKPAPKH